MSDKDKPAPDYESSLPQRPVNLDSKVPIQMARKCTNAKPGEPAGSYYLNVAQKGKLMLPTALWILLIIAALSFLTLLASLNKSINALDTLVEIEQDKEARAIISERLERARKVERQLERLKWSSGEEKLGNKKSLKHEHQHKKRRKNRKHEDEMKELENVDSLQFLDLQGARPMEPQPLLPIEPSWFAMPSWTSLEPVRQHQPAQPQLAGPPMPPMGLINEIVRNMPETPDAIIIQEGPMEQPPAGLVNSLMKQMAPLLDSIVPHDSGDLSGTLSVVGRAEPPATISAKIDNLNVHINPEQRRPGGQARDELAEVSPLGKSLDELLAGQLVGPPPPPMPHKGHAHHHPHPHHQPHLREWPFEEEAKPMRPHRRPMGPPFSPLSELLNMAPMRMGGQSPDGMMLMKISALDGEPASHSESSLKQHKLGPAGEEPQEGQLLISISAGSEPSGETNRHQVSNTRRPALGHSPYEQSVPDLLLLNPFELENKLAGQPQRHNKHRPDHHVVKPGKPAEAPWDLLASEMAEALVEDALKQHAEKPAHKNEAPQFIIIDDLPLGPKPMGEQQASLPNFFKPLPELSNSNEFHKAQKVPLGDMFSMIFRPAPDSTLLAGETKQAKTDQPTSSTPFTLKPTKAISEENPRKPTTAATKMATTEVPIISRQPEPSMSSMEPTMSPEAMRKVDAIISELPRENSTSLPTGTGSTGKPARQDAEDLFSDFLRPLFTLPQMSGSQQTASTSGSRPSGGSSANSPKESMQCECQKLPAGSSSGSASSSSSSGGPNVGRSPSQSFSSSSGGGGDGSSSGGSRGGSASSGGNSSGGSSSGSSSGAGNSSSSSRPASSSGSSSSGGGGGGGGSSGSGNSGGGSSGSSSSGGSDRSSNSSGSSSGGRSNSNPSSGSSSSSSNSAEPIGYVPLNTRPNAAPSAFATSALTIADPPALMTAAQSRPDSGGQNLASLPAANARPGSILSALNNNTNQLLPRLINRLNNTDLPKFKSNSTPPLVKTLLELPNPNRTTNSQSSRSSP